MAPADCGPTRSMPRASTQPIEPPPAPIDSMSTIASDVSSPATSRAGPPGHPPTGGDGHVERRAAHVAADHVGTPAAAATAIDAATPAAGPDAASRMGACRASRAVMVPPPECTSRTGTDRPSRASVTVELVDARRTAAMV